MTTKGPSHKQVIVPMNSEVAGRFLKDSSMHVININHALKNIKSKIMANFIHVKDKGIVISTNNVALPSNLQEIEKYVKSLLANNSDQRWTLAPGHRPFEFALRTCCKSNYQPCFHWRVQVTIFPQQGLHVSM